MPQGIYEACESQYESDFVWRKTFKLMVEHGFAYAPEKFEAHFEGYAPAAPAKARKKGV